MAIGALVCGILSLIGGFIPVVNYFTLVLAIVGIVLGVKARKDLAEQGLPTGMATAGMVLSIVSLSLTVLVIIASVACVACFASSVGGLGGLL